MFYSGSKRGLIRNLIVQDSLIRLVEMHPSHKRPESAAVFEVVIRRYCPESFPKANITVEKLTCVPESVPTPVIVAPS
jgi:hypothetical protein